MWFRRNVSVLNTISVNTANTTRVMTSWITVHWIKVKGPPPAVNASQLAGTRNIYSRYAFIQLIAMIKVKSSVCDQFHSEKFRRAYQATTINELLKTNGKMPHQAFIVVSKCLWL